MFAQSSLFQKQDTFHKTNQSASCTIQVPCFDKLKIVHNTVLKKLIDFKEFGMDLAKEGECTFQTMSW